MTPIHFVRIGFIPSDKECWLAIKTEPDIRKGVKSGDKFKLKIMLSIKVLDMKKISVAEIAICTPNDFFTLGNTYETNIREQKYDFDITTPLVSKVFPGATLHKYIYKNRLSFIRGSPSPK